MVATATAVVSWQLRNDNTILAEAEAARRGHLDGRIAEGDPLPQPAMRDALLRKTLGMNVRPPELSRFGFQLVHMDLYVRPAGGAAQLRYSDRAQRALTIYVRPSDGSVQFDIVRRGETHVCVWQDDVVGAVIIASVSAAEMLRIASSAYTALNL
jgi:anti-sigma factor RsiW